MHSQCQNRSQQDLKLAAECVSKLEPKSKVADIYGGLCHEFPVFVRNAGLCQALAFHCDKATSDKTEKSDRAQAHDKLLEHVAKVLEVDKNALLSTIQNAETREYFFYTRRILAAWVFFKRFAVSILKVETGAAEENL